MMKYSKKFRENIINKNILITGGAGFLGSHLCEDIICYSKKIYVIDNLSTGSISNLKNIKDIIKFKKFDLTNYSKLINFFKKNKIDIVFNLATIPLPYSFSIPKKTCDVNIKVMLNLLEIQRFKLFKTLCQISSSEVYGTRVSNMNEKHVLNPTTSYASGKAAADLILKSYVNMFNLDSFILRPFNIFGPRQKVYGKNIAVFPTSIERILKKKKPIIYGTGNQSRDFIYVKDVAEIIIKLFQIVKKGEEVNICSGKSTKIKDLIYNIIKISNLKIKPSFKKVRQSDVFMHKGDNRKLKKMITLKKLNFQKKILMTFKFYEKKFKSKIK